MAESREDMRWGTWNLQTGRAALGVAVGAKSHTGSSQWGSQPETSGQNPSLSAELCEHPDRLQPHRGGAEAEWS